MARKKKDQNIESENLKDLEIHDIKEGELMSSFPDENEVALRSSDIFVVEEQDINSILEHENVKANSVLTKSFAELRKIAPDVFGNFVRTSQLVDNYAVIKIHDNKKVFVTNKKIFPFCKIDRLTGWRNSILTILNQLSLIDFVVDAKLNKERPKLQFTNKGSWILVHCFNIRVFEIRIDSEFDLSMLDRLAEATFDEMRNC